MFSNWICYTLIGIAGGYIISRLLLRIMGMNTVHFWPLLHIIKRTLLASLPINTLVVFMSTRAMFGFSIETAILPILIPALIMSTQLFVRSYQERKLYRILNQKVSELLLELDIKSSRRIPDQEVQYPSNK